MILCGDHILRRLSVEDLQESLVDVVDVIDIESFNGDYKVVTIKIGISEVQVRNIVKFK